MGDLLFQIVSGGYSPPPDYSAIWSMFLTFAFTCIVTIFAVPDIKRNARYVLVGLAVLTLIAALFTPTIIRAIPVLEPPLRNLASNPFTWFVLVILIFEIAVLSPQFAKWRNPRIDVVGPLANDPVQLKTVVFGMVHPHHHPVRVMIHSGDGRYHRQDAPTVFSKEGTRWSVECQFVLQNSGGFDEHEIVAIDGNVEVDKVCDVLPSDIVKSLPVKVRRVIVK